jgi:hypothetical protein
MVLGRGSCKCSDSLPRLRRASKEIEDIDSVSAGELIVLIHELEAQAGSFPLDPALVAELRAKVESLDIASGLKNSLLKKVERLEKLSGVSNSLSNFIAAVGRKGERGKLSNEDAQALTDLLTQLENLL